MIDSETNSSQNLKWPVHALLYIININNIINFNFVTNIRNSTESPTGRREAERHICVAIALVYTFVLSRAFEAHVTYALVVDSQITLLTLLYSKLALSDANSFIIGCTGLIVSFHPANTVE